MLYMLDTNICSYILKNHPASVKVHFDEVGQQCVGHLYSPYWRNFTTVRRGTQNQYLSERN